MEKLNYKGYTIEILQNDSPLNPMRDWDCNVGTMVCFHNRYDLGSANHGYDQSDYESWDELKAAIEEKEGELAAILPLFLYDHSGITMSTSTEYPFNCRWDSMTVGFIFASRKKVEEMYGEHGGRTDEEIKEYLISEVNTYDQFLTGDVYGYNIEEVDDSCNGYFGSDHEKSGLLESAQNAIDCHIKYETKKHGEKVKNWIKNNVPLVYRNQLTLI